MTVLVRASLLPFEAISREFDVMYESAVGFEMGSLHVILILSWKIRYICFIATL
ncbi:hypothetical protein CDL12_25009 [Handroanthus impetiginosus]|uniref:Uncharacterized protein n=1 Tax=Handroanthus impetiginosus TaxID=429701 RepID=A0A2G9GBA1_9LAMI|nr:hypothetical protein CDL12_25009 [Handroanthus impetiginosus]